MRQLIVCLPAKVSSNWLSGRHSAISLQKCYKTSISSTNKMTDRLVVNKNLTLRYCHPKPLATEDSKKEDKPVRRLAVFFAWMLAKDKHLEKYRNLYFKRGYDVLTVTTTPLQLLLPERGSQQVAVNAMNFLSDNTKNYPEIVVHAFSVGAYQFGEMLVELSKEKNQSAKTSITRAVKGVISDSCADMEAIPDGLSRAVTNNPLLRFLLRNYIALHMKIFYSVATKHYAASSNAWKNNLIRCPSLIFVSSKDPVGNPPANQKVRESWERCGIDVKWKCFDKSTHVGHFHKYPEEYQEEIDSFLHKVMK